MLTFNFNQINMPCFWYWEKYRICSSKLEIPRIHSKLNDKRTIFWARYICCVPLLLYYSTRKFWEWSKGGCWRWVRVSSTVWDGGGANCYAMLSMYLCCYLNFQRLLAFALSLELELSKHACLHPAVIQNQTSRGYTI